MTAALTARRGFDKLISLSMANQARYLKQLPYFILHTHFTIAVILSPDQVTA